MEWAYVAIGVIVLLVLGAALAKPSRCTICGNAIKKKYHTWQIGGKKHHLCPHCNSSMERKQSKQAMSKFK